MSRIDFWEEFWGSALRLLKVFGVIIVITAVIATFLSLDAAAELLGWWFIPVLAMVYFIGWLITLFTEKLIKLLRRAQIPSEDQQHTKMSLSADSKRDRIEQELRVVYTDYWGLPPDWQRRRRFILARDAYRCQQCGVVSYDQRLNPLHVHHIIPKSCEEGNHALENLRVLCERCHSEQPGKGHELIKDDLEKRRRKVPKKRLW